MKVFHIPLWMKPILIGWKFQKIKNHGRFGLVPNLTSPKLQVRDFWKKWKKIKGGLNCVLWPSLSQGYHKFCETPNPTKLGKFKGSPSELWTHGIDATELYDHVAITTPLSFYFFFFLSSPPSLLLLLLLKVPPPFILQVPLTKT
jgi:hypothetical protein